MGVTIPSRMLAAAHQRRWLNRLHSHPGIEHQYPALVDSNRIQLELDDVRQVAGECADPEQNLFEGGDIRGMSSSISG